MGESQLNLYESQALLEIIGPAIRPGGFELTERGLSHCRLVPGARVLDVGCGTGVVVDYVRRKYGLAAVGIDFSSVLLEKGIRINGSSPLVRGRAEQLPVTDGIFEAVLSECVLSLCREPQNVLREIQRVMQAGGYLVLSDVYTRGPAGPAWSAKPSIHCCLQGAVDRTTVLDRVADAGFDLLMWEDHSPLLKQLAARLAWTYGSLDDFWSEVGGCCAAGAMGTRRTGACIRPGYFLLVARKR